MSPLTPDAWVRVNRSALRHNVSALQEWLAQEAQTTPQIIAVVKANAYGHGAAETAHVFQSAGVRFFAVTTPAEGMELRQAGISGNILVFLPPFPDQIPAMVQADLDITVMDDQLLDVIHVAAQQHSKAARVHLKIDTGMGRFGALPHEALPVAQKIAASSGIIMAGTYTHFARALEKNPAATQRAFLIFQNVLRAFEHAGVDPGLRHCANSAAALRFREMHLDAIRPGTVLYGQYPSPAVPRVLTLQESWQLQARVAVLRNIPAGSSLGYGGEYVTKRPTRVAILPVGYADGLTLAPASASRGRRGLIHTLRELAGLGHVPFVQIHGQKAPVVGRIAMQTCLVDVTDIPDVVLGETASIPARRVLTSARLPRIYED